LKDLKFNWYFKTSFQNNTNLLLKRQIKFKYFPSRILGEKEKNKKTKITVDFETKQNIRTESKIYYSKNILQIFCIIQEIIFKSCDWFSLALVNHENP
jgi:hypothetical protein